MLYAQAAGGSIPPGSMQNRIDGVVPGSPDVQLPEGLVQ